MWLSPVWDRTQADVDFARENRNNPEHLKGALNYSDWARITGNIYYLAEMLTAYGRPVTVTCKNEWSMHDIPKASEIQHVRDDLDKVRRAFYIMKDTPSTPMLPLNHYKKINDMERILHDVETLFANMLASLVQCGEIECGEEFI